jgi:ATP-dependent protease HslVU (ClpYQ) peptidase subunit
MQAIETLKAKGQVKLELTRADGTVETIDIKNLVVNTGLNYIVSRMKDTTETAMSHMAIGSGSTAAAAGNTALGTELGRVTLTSTTVSTNTIQYVASFPAGTGTGTVYEAGIFNASSGGTLLCRTVFGIVTKDAGDSLAITWTITVS